MKKEKEREKMKKVNGKEKKDKWKREKKIKR